MNYVVYRLFYNYCTWVGHYLGLNGKFSSYLKVLYQNSSCRVRVQDRLSKESGVDMGLRQGYVLSPLLFSLYINGVVTRLHDGKCGIRCGGDMVPGLLFADDTSLVASDKEGLNEFKFEFEFILSAIGEHYLLKEKPAGISHITRQLYLIQTKYVRTYDYMTCIRLCIRTCSFMVLCRK